MQDTHLDIRLKALDWLLSATSGWLCQNQSKVQQLSCDNHETWKAVEVLAYFHNVESLLYWMITNSKLAVEIPERLIRSWEQAYFDNFLRNNKYYEILKTLLCKCEAEEIPALVVKGPALTGRVYNDTALRTLSDIDILCPRNYLHQLLRAGRDMDCELKITGDIPASVYHIVMQHTPSKTLLEFHFMPYDVIKNQTVFMELACKHREFTDINGARCPVLCSEMELLFNVAHLYQHRFDAPLKHYLDIAGLMVFCGNQINWDKIETMACRFGLKQAFARATGFLLSAGLLTQLPASTRFEIKGNSQQQFNTSLHKLLALMDEPMSFSTGNFLWNFRMALKNRQGLKNKLDYVLDKTPFPILSSLCTHRGIRSAGEALRYFFRHLLFYCRRLILKPLRYSSPKKNDTSTKARIHAKDTIIRQLQESQRPGQLV